MAFKFEQLNVWQKALILTKDIHELTVAFSKEAVYGLTSQIKRAADSVALNVAEGSTGQSNAEFKRFLGYAIRSAIEVVACLHIGKMRNLIPSEDFAKYYDQAEEIVNVTSSTEIY